MANYSVFSPGEFHGQRSLAGYSSWRNCIELGMTEWPTARPNTAINKQIRQKSFREEGVAHFKTNKSKMRTIVAERTEERDTRCNIQRCRHSRSLFPGQQQSRRAHGQGKALSLHGQLPCGRSTASSQVFRGLQQPGFRQNWSRDAPPPTHSLTATICPCKRRQGPQLTLRMTWGCASAPWPPSLVLTDIDPVIHLIASHTVTSAAAKLFALGFHYCYQP